MNANINQSIILRGQHDPAASYSLPQRIALKPATQSVERNGFMKVTRASKFQSEQVPTSVCAAIKRMLKRHQYRKKYCRTMFIPAHVRRNGYSGHRHRYGKYGPYSSNFTSY